MIWFGEEFFFVQTSGDITFFPDIQDGVSLFRSIISLITRDDVVSQRLKFGSAFLSSSWESKIALFF